MPPAKRKPPKPKPKPKPQPPATVDKAAIIAAQKARRRNPRCPACGSPADQAGCINPACT